MQYKAIIDVYLQIKDGENKQYIINKDSIIIIDYIDDLKQIVWFRSEKNKNNVLPDYLSLLALLTGFTKL